MKHTFKQSLFILLTLFALTFSSLGVTPTQAANGDFVWAKGMGGSSSDSGYNVAVDGSGNVYTTGIFQGTVDFDPGAGTADLTSTGFHDIFVSKLDANGNFVWAKGMGGSFWDYGYGIAVDKNEGVYTIGNFEGVVDFDPGAGTNNLTSVGGTDIFISKLDTNGDFVWAKGMGGASQDQGRSIAVDGSGNVYTTGHFQGTVDFDPGAGTANLTSVGSADIFVSKLDTNGDFVWAKRIGGLSWESGYSIAADGSGNVYTTGSFEGTADFDPDMGTTNLTSAGISDIFVSKLDANGDFVWAKRMGGSSWDSGHSIALDASGNVYTTGYFQDIVDFDPGAGTADLTSVGTYDIFVSKLDANGAFIWAKRMGGSSNDSGYRIALDESGNAYTTGSFAGTVDFDPGASTANLTSAGGGDIFVSMLDTNGDFVWAKGMGGSSVDIGFGTAVDGSGNVYTTGFFEGTVDFDPGAGTANLTSVGGADIFVSKLNGSSTVTFNGNESTGGSMSPQTAGSPTALTANAFTRTGYAFNGWNTAANGSGTAYVNGAIYNFSADVTLYAQWTALINLPTGWVGSVSVTSDKDLVSVGRPHIGAEVASYSGFSSGSTTAFVPMLFKNAFGGDYDAALYVQNVSGSSASVTIQFYDNTGVLNCTKTDTIASLASKGYWLPSLTCTSGSLPTGWVGGVKVTSNQNIVAVGRPHIGAEVMTYNGFTGGSTSAFIPRLFKAAFGDSYNAAFYVQNVGGSTATLTLEYFDSSGTLNCTKADTLASLASRGYWVPSASCDTGSLPAGWVGGVRVSSNQPIVTVGRLHIGTQITTYDGFSSGSVSSFVPMLFKDAFGGSYDAAFYLQNVGGASASVSIKYYDNAGTLNCTKSDTIAPLASKGYWVPSDTCDSGSLPAGWVGGVEVTSDQPIVSVGRPHIDAQVTTYNGFSGGATSAFLPMLFKDAFGGSYDSAFYLQNTEASAANVTIQFYDSTGTLTCSRTDTIQPRATLGFWVPSVNCFP